MRIFNFGNLFLFFFFFFSSFFGGCHGLVGNICPLGHFCPLNSTHPTPCPGGSFSNSTGLQECLPCPSGFYCPVGAKDFKEYDCPAGYVCGPGQESPFALPCPNGTFSAQLNLREVSECTSCTPGMHCSSPALTSPSGPCHAGFYCTIRSRSPEPQDGSGLIEILIFLGGMKAGNTKSGGGGYKSILS